MVPTRFTTPPGRRRSSATPRPTSHTHGTRSAASQPSRHRQPQAPPPNRLAAYRPADSRLHTTRDGAPLGRRPLLLPPPMRLADAVVALAVPAYLVLVAMLIGSFINLAADRLPRRESIVRPRSHCRSCGRVLNLVDLIPIAGYAIRGGRCAGCGKTIGAASPAVEGLCGAPMLASLVLLGPLGGALVGAAAVSVVGVGAGGVGVGRSCGAKREYRSG